ncbi:hypothetical protein ASD45_06865 [Pseudolabrys sp. Root1462]|uniref:hypothetical protein n=1 Tax=Pseudolabrys sp. Root1462 TaxID=1736466 RepID=UPI0007035AB3|nr:hypothetical protein [Pseudolabrys sp. Root1462]KQZ00605.1 hypothetical protein ASD45_06865 [Pseudolabrys sp. Root1462]
MDRSMISKLICVVLVAAIMLPLGRWVYPHISQALNGTQFEALEAVVGASLGFGLSSFFG